MLSKIDIEKELGKGINIVPFKEENIKENSLNLTASSLAWTMNKGEVFVSNTGLVEKDVAHEKKYTFSKGDKCVISMENKNVIIILPFSTTLVQTKEVLASSNYIGGTYHSKVGLVSKGLGHIGTMLGPNFSGHSLIAVHNITAFPIYIEVDETFVSIIFHRLDTPLNSPNATKNGHLEKFSALGIKLSTEDLNFLNEDWKSNRIIVKEKMKEDPNFIKYRQKKLKRKFENLKKYLNLSNFILLIIIVPLFIGIHFIAVYFDKKNGNNDWTDRFWNVGFSGIFIYVLSLIKTFIKTN